MGRGCRARAHRKYVRERAVRYTADWQQVNGLNPPQRCSLERAPPSEASQSSTGDKDIHADWWRADGNSLLKNLIQCSMSLRVFALISSH